jgi:hypothetical protein
MSSKFNSITELFLTTTPSDSPPKMAPIRIIPKKNNMKKTKIPIMVANTFPKNFIIIFF